MKLNAIGWFCCNVMDPPVPAVPVLVESAMNR